jgi:hypothetical protein
MLVLSRRLIFRSTNVVCLFAVFSWFGVSRASETSKNMVVSCVRLGSFDAGIISFIIAVIASLLVLDRIYSTNPLGLSSTDE